MTRTIRRAAALFVAVATAFVLAGCGTGPSQVNSAAIVGDRSVPLGAVQEEINWLLDNVQQAKQAKGQRKLDLFSRNVVRDRVVHELVEVAAEREGLRATQAEVDGLIQHFGGVKTFVNQAGIMRERVRQFATDWVLLEKLAKSQASRLTVHAVGTLIVKESPGNTAKDQARAIGEKIAANPADAEKIVQDSGNQLVDHEESLATMMQNQPALAVSALYGAPEGSVVVIQPSQQQAGWLVGLIRERKMSGPAGKPLNVGDRQILYLTGMRLLQPLADELGVRLNPRYGVWDEVAMAPAPHREELSGYVLRSRTVQP